eukprot:CAMPEP_0185724442 /NCGR_PEP_ID=MMETSP1171-20130828/924_1 /TAXON_ID=374046 /ORGANISM="Helicotheca tamensis, Strain CCMP826" /LENGTH=556 /DNA_ID=CAMNT_0028392293 /DNA_START=25 /DNA_END=1695 /DNA_ORIENTATION=-
MGQTCSSPLKQCISDPAPPNKLKVRYSLRELEKLYDSDENPKLLEDFMTAWDMIKKKDATDLRGFFAIGGFHGEPFVGAGAIDTNYWGGYCNHGNVLFPTWHRVYLKKLEEALDLAVPGVALAYWDETSEESLRYGIPHSLTDELFHYKTPDENGKYRDPIKNPLRSYTFPVEVEDANNGDKVYKKPEGYETVRYPLSGLVGTEEARSKSELHNSQFPSIEEQVKLLNKNVIAWLTGTEPVENVDSDDPKKVNLYKNFKECLAAPTYTLFSNTTSANEHNKKELGKQIIPLESPHNTIHLAVGGYDEPGLEAGIITGANGDMGENNTAGFDPIFYLHHCNIDRMFWLWQKIHNCTDKLVIDEKDKGAQSNTFAHGGQGPVVNFPSDVTLTMSTPLTPFMVNEETDQRMYTSYDVVNIEKQLGYTYSEGSLSSIRKSVLRSDGTVKGHGKLLNVSGIDRTLFAGSFVIAAYAEIDGQKRMIGYETILNPWRVEGCANCQNHLVVNFTFNLESLSLAEIESAIFSVTISHRGEELPDDFTYETEVVGGAEKSIARASK